MVIIYWLINWFLQPRQPNMQLFRLWVLEATEVWNITHLHSIHPWVNITLTVWKSNSMNLNSIMHIILILYLLYKTLAHYLARTCCVSSNIQVFPNLMPLRYPGSLENTGCRSLLGLRTPTETTSTMIMNVLFIGTFLHQLLSVAAVSRGH